MAGHYEASLDDIHYIEWLYYQQVTQSLVNDFMALDDELLTGVNADGIAGPLDQEAMAGNFPEVEERPDGDGNQDVAPEPEPAPEPERPPPPRFEELEHDRFMNRWQQARQPRRLTMEQRRIRKKKYGKACAECRSRKVKCSHVDKGCRQWAKEAYYPSIPWYAQIVYSLSILCPIADIGTRVGLTEETELPLSCALELSKDPEFLSYFRWREESIRLVASWVLSRKGTQSALGQGGIRAPPPKTKPYKMEGMVLMVTYGFFHITPMVWLTAISPWSFERPLVIVSTLSTRVPNFDAEPSPPDKITYRPLLGKPPKRPSSAPSFVTRGRGSVWEMRRALSLGTIRARGPIGYAQGSRNPYQVEECVDFCALDQSS